MFTLTAAAAKQVRKAASDGDMEDLSLRIAATREDDGAIAYRMGFDEFEQGDTVVSSRGVDVLIRGEGPEVLSAACPKSVEALEGLIGSEAPA